MISPCVNILRQLSTAINSFLGSHQGTTHAPPDLKDDIETLMRSLEEHEVYTVNKGRTLDEDDPPVKDVIAIGTYALTDSSSNPLDEYNKAFKRLQTRRRLTPIVGGAPSQSSGSAPRSPRDSGPQASTSSHASFISPAHPPPSDASRETPIPPAPMSRQPEGTPATYEDDPPEGGEDSDTSSSGSSESDGDEMGELDQVLDEDDEPTLERLEAEDVSLDMDGDRDLVSEGEDSGDEEGFEDVEDGIAF